MLAANTLTGDSVQNSSGETLGKVDEIAIDSGFGKVAYAVVLRRIPRYGSKLFALPSSTLRVDADQKHFIIDV